MAGIYVHIPFCRKACHYCDFHFSTTLHQLNDLVDALLREIELRAPEAQAQAIETIYFGGGTPSILSNTDLHRILEAIHKQYSVSSNAEITLEANPDDIQTQRVKDWMRLGINRLSIGIQSFFDDDLLYMNRTHNGHDAYACLQIAQDAGIGNLNADLIFGFPLLSDAKWHANIETMLRLQPTHLSCYSMTVEKGTALHHFVQKKQVPPINPEQAATHYEYLMNTLAAAQYEQYEISNFAQAGFRSKHNSRYWQGVPYIGFGPSAHSYAPPIRRWNVSNNTHYIQALRENRLPSEQEILSATQQQNEQLMVALRTVEGLNVSTWLQNLSKTQQETFVSTCNTFIEQGHLQQQGHQLQLTNSGKLLADAISGELFLDNETSN